MQFQRWGFRSVTIQCANLKVNQSEYMLGRDGEPGGIFGRFWLTRQSEVERRRDCAKGSSLCGSVVRQEQASSLCGPVVRQDQASSFCSPVVRQEQASSFCGPVVRQAQSWTNRTCRHRDAPKLIVSGGLHCEWLRDPIIRTRPGP